jgi:hypothetical protein
MSAILGLLLALVDCGWAIADAEERSQNMIPAQRSIIKKVVWDLESPCWWFGLSGILYTVTSLALLKRAQHQKTKDETGHRGIR